MHGLLCRHGQGQRLGIGEADILGGKPHEPARNVERIVTAFQHAGEPVERGIGIGTTEGLVERGDGVVVGFATLVVT